MDDRRRYHRVGIEIPITFRVPPKKREIDATVIDVSGTGLLFRTDEAVKERQELLVYLPLPSRAKTEMHVIVSRVAQEPSAEGSKYWVGVRIADRLKFDEREFIKFYASRIQDFKNKK